MQFFHTVSCVIFTINVGIGTYFVYYKYVNYEEKTDAEEKFYCSNNNY